MSSYHSSVELPAPSAEQIEHSTSLIERIVDHIQSAGGVISFRDYMQHCLYEPGLGYYVAGSTKFGAQGDFITAPEVSSLFGMSLANQAAALFGQGLAPCLLEFGAGTGKLCADMIQQLNDSGTEWNSYQILETSADLQQRQKLFLQQRLSAEDLSKIEWLKTFPVDFDGLVLGNEVLDAMPVNVVLKKGGWVELGVGFAEHKFQWMEFSGDREVLSSIEAIDSDDSLADHYCTELNLNYQPWCKSLAQSCHQAVALMIDYGYEQSQYYHPLRNTGTLMCFYQHRSHPDPFIYPGLQDITAFVDFDAFADAAMDAGFTIAGLTTQANFLMQNGLLELMQAGQVDGLQQLELSQQVKNLTLPGEMGEKFRVIGLQKGLDLDLQAFSHIPAL